jgi:long-chain fatty acid transport protein
MKRFGRSVVGVAYLVFVTFAAVRSAKAAGFASARFGGEHGNVTESNPLALYYNPGGIGFGKDVNAIVDVQLALRRATWSHTAPTPDPALSQPPDMQVGNSGTATLFNVFGAPALAATMKVGNFAFGGGLFVPFGGRASWDKNDQVDAPTRATYPRVADGVARWHIIDGALTFIYGTVGAAYRLGPVSLGVSGNLVVSSVSLNQAKNPNTGVPDTTNEGRVTLDVSGLHASFAVGAMVEVVPNRVWVGGSYQSQPGLGPQTLKGTLDIKDVLPGTGTLREDVTFRQALPDIYRAGARWRVNDAVELRVFGDYTRWSVMQAQCLGLQTKAMDGSLVPHDCNVHPNGSDATGGFVITNIPRNWNDTYGIRVGGSYWVKPEIELFAGLGYETAASPDSTLEPGTADGNNIGVALGGRFLLWDSLYLAASYTHLQFLDRDNTGKSQLESINGVGVSYPTVQQDGGGRYTQWIGIIDLNVQKQF